MFRLILLLASLGRFGWSAVSREETGTGTIDETRTGAVRAATAQRAEAAPRLQGLQPWSRSRGRALSKTLELNRRRVRSGSGSKSSLELIEA